MQTNTLQTNIPGTSSGSKVELSISCKDLPDLDTLSKSDPQVTVELRQRHGDWKPVGKTEVIDNNLSPKFSTRIKVDYFFQELQELRFNIADVDKHKSDKIGSVVSMCLFWCCTDSPVTLGDILGSQGNTKTERIHHKYRGKSFITVTAQELKSGAEKDVYFTISGSNLDKKDFLGKSDPFLEISRPSSTQPGKWSMIHRTETIKKTLDPQWKPFELPMTVLNLGKMDDKLKFDVYDWNSSGKSDFIGSFEASLNEITKKSQWPLVNPKKAKKRGYRDSGVLNIKVVINDCYTFLDYIMGGTEINLMVAIDFTGSNGKPTDPNSLHAIGKGSLNEYEQVLTTCGNILLSYDTDGAVPAFGFGAKLSEPYLSASKANIPHDRGGDVSQCFHMNKNPSDPEIHGGLSNVLSVYHETVNSDKIKFYGPTTFAYVIKEAAKLAEEHHQNKADAQAFVILLIVTDGVIPQDQDFIATKEAIIEASMLPMAIVIVGVGQEDFSQMDELDADDGLLKVRGKEAEADIVQFVPFRNFKGKPDELAAHVLGEIPGQLVSYMKRHRIKARPPPTAEEIARMQMNYMNAFATNNPGSATTTTATTTNPFRQDSVYQAGRSTSHHGHDAHSPAPHPGFAPSPHDAQPPAHPHAPPTQPPGSPYPPPHDPNQPPAGTNHPPPGYGGYPPAGGYGYPPPGYGTQQPGYGYPPPGYGYPPPGYGYPPPGYGYPPYGTNAPPPGTNTPPPGPDGKPADPAQPPAGGQAPPGYGTYPGYGGYPPYGAPPGTNTPPPGPDGKPADPSQPPAGGQPPPGYGYPPAGYGYPPPGYGQPPPGPDGQPPAGYNTNAPPGYGYPPAGYGAYGPPPGNYPPQQNVTNSAPTSQ